MRIGLQKLTLQDYPGKVACILFTAGCNFRCPYCHNGDLVLGPEPGLSAEDGLAFLRKRAGLLDGVCISGGEPLMHAETLRLAAEAKAMGYSVKIDTNGSYPAVLEQMIAHRLVDYVAMDIKNSPQRYAETIGLRHFSLEPVRKSVSLLLSGAVAYEFRTTVVREFHRPEDLEAIAHWIAGADRYFLQSFQDGEKVIRPGLHGYTQEELIRIAARLKDKVPSVQVRSA